MWANDEAAIGRVGEEARRARANGRGAQRRERRREGVPHDLYLAVGRLSLHGIGIGDRGTAMKDRGFDATVDSWEPICSVPTPVLVHENREAL